MTDLEDWVITDARVMELHEQVMRFSDKPLPDSATKEDCVDGSIGAARNAEHYYDDGASLTRRPGLVFAGHLLFYLVKNHCFSDGNKRTGLASCSEVLGKIGLTIELSDSELVEYINSIADDSVPSAGAVVHWLADRLRAL